MIRLSKQQQAVLDYIKEFSATAGFPPSRADIASHFEYKSQNSAQEILASLKRKGYIEIAYGVSRGIKVLA